MNIFDIIGGAIKQGIQNVPSALSQAQQSYQNFRTDLPTNVETAQRYIRQAIAPKYYPPSFDQSRRDTSYGEEVYNQQSPMERVNYDFANEGIYMDPGAMKSGSAELQPMQVYPNDPNLSALKKASLNTMNLRSAMQRYLQTIPVQRGNLKDFIVNEDGTTSSAGGIANGGGSQGFQLSDPGGSWETNTNVTQDPNIVLNKTAGTSPKGWGNPVLQHEYLHVAPRVAQARMGMEKLLQNLPKKSPIRDAALQYYRNGELPPNPEELFATLGEQYGQYVLMMPEIRDYYKNIFTQPTDNSNVIDYSYEPWKTNPESSFYGQETGREKLKLPVKVVYKKNK